MHDTTLNDLNSAVFCCDITENGLILNRDHIYYQEVLGQMAISQLAWAYFVVYSEKFILIECIRLSNEDWERTKVRLDHFYF